MNEVEVKEEIYEIIKAIKKQRTENYYKNEEEIKRLNKLIELHEKAEEVMREYNLPVYSSHEFKDIEEHLNYLKEKGLYNIKQRDNFYFISDGYNEMISNKTIFKLDKGNYSLYHGTSISNAKNIVRKGIFKARKSNTDIIQYNKIFFSSTLDYAKAYGLVGGMGNNYNLPDNTDKYIIFECNPEQYDVYGYISGKEYIIWGDVSTDIISNIYLCEKDVILKEISKDELLRLEV